MVKLRGMTNRDVIEMGPATRVKLVDGLHYSATNEVRYIGNGTWALGELKAYDLVEVDTGLDDDEPQRLYQVMPRRTHGFATLISTMLMALATFGCSGATYHYSYTCYGKGCPVPTQLPMQAVYYPYVQPMSYPQLPMAQVQYVDRPHEIYVRDGHIDTSEFRPERRAAQPQMRE